MTAIKAAISSPSTTFAPTTLAEAAFVTPVGEGHYTAQLRADWCIGVGSYPHSFPHFSGS
jgi:hypothetical protein